MENVLYFDSKKIDSLLDLIKSEAIDYLNQLPTFETPTSQSSDMNLENDFLPEDGLGSEATLSLFKLIKEKLIVSSNGPRYLGFVTGGTTPAALMGDWLTGVYDQNSMKSSGQGDISGKLDEIALQMLLQLFNLPHYFLGGFVTGATMSNFTCLAVARQYIGNARGKNYAEDGLTDNILVIAGTIHSSAIKSLSMLGIGSKTLIRVPSVAPDRESIDIASLKKIIKQNKNTPFILITSAGTVNTGDFDNFSEISELKNKYNFWWHIDAAFGGFAACSKSKKNLVDGWEYADSITVDCHKWLNVPYENGVFFIHEKHKCNQFSVFQNNNSAYLGESSHLDFMNFLPENSRRLKSLPVWFTLKAYGKNGYIQIVEKSISLAEYFGNWITQSSDFELVSSVKLNVVCFTLKNTSPALIKRFITQLNNRKVAFMSPTTFNNRQCIRVAFVNWRTDFNDVDFICRQMIDIIKL